MPGPFHSLRWIIFLFASGLGYAQVNTAALAGTVRDSSNGVLPGARVTVRHIRTNYERVVRAGDDGSYEISGLPVGEHVVQAEYKSLATQTRTGLALAAGSRVRLDFALRPGDVTESLAVAGSVALISTAAADSGNLIDSHKVTRLPINGRNFTLLMALQPGVQGSNVGGRQSFNLNGLSQWGLNITMDGTDASFSESASFGDPSGKTVINTVSVESIHEFRVVSGPFSAETGRAAGGAVNIVTRSGGNELHGVLFEYGRNSMFDARNFFAAKRDLLVQNQFGGNVGGAIRKNHVFFFASFESARRRVGQQMAADVPTAAFRQRSPAVYHRYFDLLPLPTEAIDDNTGLLRRSDSYTTDEHLGNGRLDFNTGNSVTTARYSVNDSESSVPNIIPQNRSIFDIRSHLLTLTNTYNFTKSVMNEARFGFDRWNVPRHNTTFRRGLGEIQIPGVLNAPNFEGFMRLVDNTFSYMDNVTWRRGRHSFKMGAEIRRVQSNRIQRQNPVYTYNSIEDFMADRPLSVRVILGQPGAGLRQWNAGFYFQDGVQVNRRLRVNLGLRWEYYTPVSEAAGRLFNVVSDPFGAFRPAGAQIYGRDLTNFDPRVGIAWDVTGRQRTIVRVGGGLYTAPLAPYFVWDTPTIDPRQPFAFNATPEDIPDLAFPLTGNLAHAIFRPTSALAMGLLPAVVGRRIIDPNLRDTYSGQWKVNVQQTLSRNFVLQTGYVGSGTVKAVNSRSLNLIDPVTGERPDPQIGEILLVENSGRRYYHALQAALRGRSARGLTMDVFYTWSHSTVYGGDDCCSGTNNVIQDFDNIGDSRGDANTDVRHALTFSYAYDLRLERWLSPSRKMARIAEGWSIQGITQIRSGLPVNILSGRDIRGNGIGGTQRVNYVPRDEYSNPDLVRVFFGRKSYTLPANGQFGDLGKNTATGPGLSSWDFSVIKNTRVWREQGIQFRASFFNLPNHPSFGNPVNTLVSPNFGQILTARPGREIQFGLRYQF